MDKLNISKNTKIYVACPANYATGGPELLHQLVHELRKLELTAYMYYYPCDKKKSPIHKSYIQYKNPYVSLIDDREENVFITPEVKTNLIYDYKNIQKVIWWLSVDNFYNSNKGKQKSLLKKILHSIGYLKIYNFDKKAKIFHFVQSEYALQHLHSKNILQASFLGDYLNNIFISEQANINTTKKDIVAYNPEKGFEFTQQIMAISQDIKFIPIKNMTKEEVSNLLSSAKVYIDFGDHPGKDRMPREAAISGCCIITNKLGSAKYYKDIPIKDEFKFNGNDQDIQLILKKISNCFIDYEVNKKKFDTYRDKIKNEQESFIDDIKRIFL